MVQTKKILELSFMIKFKNFVHVHKSYKLNLLQLVTVLGTKVKIL